MTKEKVTLDKIASKLGITKVTVSKALKNQPGVSEALKKQIIELSNQMGYVTRKEKPIQTVYKLGLIVPKRFFLEIDDFYTKIFYYLNRECALLNYTLNLYILEPKEEDALNYPLSFTQDQSELSGLFIAGEIKSDYLKLLLNLPIPIVAIDFYKNNLRLDYIVSDNYRMGYFTTNYLVEKGHHTIGFVGNPNYTSSVMDRYCGYFRALTQHGLEIRKEWHIVNNDESGKYHFDFSLPDQLPSAFVCYCDMAAHILLSKLQINGVRVPEDVSLISFDNTEISQTMVPALTTMHIDRFEFAEKALKRMQWRLQHPEEEAQFVYVNSKLIERDSVKSLSDSPPLIPDPDYAIGER